MKLVRIVKNWDWPNLLRQTPGARGVWQDIRFTLNPVDRCDYVVICNTIPHRVEVTCPPECVWSVIGEPPQPCFGPWHTDLPQASRVYTVDEQFRGPRFIHGQTALPWHVDRDYDQLVACPCPQKTRDLSWVTSDIAVFPGHRARLRFLRAMSGKIDFDLFGRGFASIEDKWDGLAPYRYSFAIENHRNPYYWTEKIADCFLAWTMPIYSGCRRIKDYFPEESMIEIDVDDPNVADRIRSEMAGDRWRRNLDAIAHARELVLNRYQFFPFIVGEIRRFEADQTEVTPAGRVVLERTPRDQDDRQEQLHDGRLNVGPKAQDNSGLPLQQDPSPCSVP